LGRKPSRYLLVKLLAEGTVSDNSLFQSVTESIVNLFGETGLSETAPRLIGYNEKKSIGILRCSRDSLEKLRAAIAMISRIDEEPVGVYVKAVSGTSKRLKSKILA
jgi:ribonuclease P/MRP protein subunit POP5